MQAAETNARQLIRAVKRAGFDERRQRGSHLHLRRDSDGRRVTVPVHKGRSIPMGTLRAILRDADISVHAEPAPAYLVACSSASYLLWNGGGRIRQMPQMTGDGGDLRP